MIRQLSLLLFAAIILSSCMQTPQIDSFTNPENSSVTDLPFGYVNDPLTLKDLPLENNSQTRIVSLNNCVYADGPYQRYNSNQDSATNAVQFSTSIPSSNPGISSTQPGYVYGGGYSNTGQQMDFGFQIDNTNELTIFMKQDPAPSGIVGGVFNVNILGDLSFDSSKLQPPIANISLYDKIYPKIVNSGGSMTMRVWTSSTRVYMQITTPITVKFYRSRSQAKTNALNSATPKPNPLYSTVSNEFFVTYTNILLPVISYGISGWGNAGDPQAMKAMVTIGQRQLDPIQGNQIVNPSAGQTFTGIKVSNLQFGTATESGAFTAKNTTINSCSNPAAPVVNATALPNATININANKGLAVLSITTPTNGGTLILNARPGDANVKGIIKTKNTGPAGSLLRVNYGENFTTTYPSKLIELESNIEHTYPTPVQNCPATASTLPIEKRVYIRALTGATSVQTIGNVFMWTATRNVLVQLICNGNPALGATTVTYDQTPVEALGKNVTGSITFKDDGTTNLDWTATSSATWLKLNVAAGTTTPTSGSLAMLIDF